MKTVSEIVNTIELIRSYRRDINMGNMISADDLNRIEDLLHDYEIMLLNLKVKE